MTDVLAGLSQSPKFYPQKLDLIRDAMLLMVMGEMDYRKASFLDDRILSPTTQAHWAPYAIVEKAMSTPASVRPLHFIFHSGHVGSTLLSRLLDETGQVLSLREPLPLRTLADAHDALRAGSSLLDSKQLDARLETFLRLWSRGFDATKAVVLKTTSVVSRFAPSLLTKRPAAKAVYLNLSAESYLATLLAGENSAIDLNGHAPQRIRRLQRFLGDQSPSLSTLSLGELAAMSWLVERLTQQAVMTQFGTRVLAIDFDRMLADPGETMGAVLRQFEIEVPHGVTQAIVQSPVLTRYSKAPEFAYSPQLRSQLLSQARREHAVELQKGLRYLELLAKQHSAVAHAL